MKKWTKIACAMAAVLLLMPIRGQAADTVSASREKKPVVSMGNRPGAVVLGTSQKQKDTKHNKADRDGNTEKKSKKNSGAQISQRNKTDTKSGAKTKQTATGKRNLNAIYILPKGYKDITIKGKAEATKKQAAQLIVANNKNLPIGCSVGEIVDLYWEEAEREGIRPDMALSQALLETGYFNFGGAVEPWQHNFCGLGTVGNGVQGAAFKTTREGVRAHIQHLLAYTSHDLPKTKLIDPRYEKARNLRLQKGLITKWSGLNWTWAMGGEYAEKVINTHQLMLRCPDKEPEGMWTDHKKQQKELEKLYEKKMKERNKLEQYKYEKPKHEKYKSENRKNEKRKK